MEPRKRKLSEEEESEPITKVFRKAELLFTLEHFCDEILLVVLKYLDSESLYNLEKTSDRFSSLVQEKKLWNNVSYMGKQLGVPSILKRLEFLQITTESLSIRGDNSKKSPPTSKQSFKAIIYKISSQCSLLHTLHFQEVWFDWLHNFRITEFPCTLKSLTFVNCNVPKLCRRSREPKIFTGIDQYMINLTELRIEYCSWFETHDVVQFSKLPSLISLSLKGCPKLLNCVPYLSLACRFGFKTLEKLDMRDTFIDDSDLQCFNVLTKLKELYLESPQKDKPAESSSEEESSDDYSLIIENRNVSSYAERMQDFAGLESPGGSDASSSSSTVIVAAPMANSSSSALEPLPPVPEIVINNAQESSEEETVDEQEENSDTEPVPSTSRAIVSGSSSTESSMSSESSIEDSAPNSSRVLVRSYINGNSPSRSLVNNPRAVPFRILRSQPRMHVSIDSTYRPSDLAVPRLLPEVPPIRLMMVDGNNYPHARYLRYGRDLPQFRQTSLISDRGILAFGIAAPQILQDVVFIRIQHRDPNTYLEKLVVRNYKNITDITLKHLANTAPKLIYVDVTGTSVTPEGVADFKTRKPDCTIITAFDEE